MNSRIFKSHEDLAQSAADSLVQRVRSGARIIGLSGGSSPRRMYEILGTHFREELGASDLVWVLEDERCVPPEHEESNSRMVKQALFAKGMAGNHRFVRFRTELEEPPIIAREFERDWHHNRIAGLDVVVLGVGDDGHTASLFPGTTIFSVASRVAAEVYVPRLEAWRVTLTLPVLERAGFKLVIATGESKRPIIEQVKAGVELPIARVTRGEAETWWFLDEAAAPG